MLDCKIRLEIVVVVEAEPLSVPPSPVLAVTGPVLLDLLRGESRGPLAVLLGGAEEIDYQRVVPVDGLVDIEHECKGIDVGAGHIALSADIGTHCKDAPSVWELSAAVLQVHLSCAEVGNAGAGYD